MNQTFTSLIEILNYRAQYQSDKPAYIFLENGETESASLTYGELDRQAKLIAAHLQHWQGERVILLYPSGLEFITAFFGCLYAGAVAVPIYPPRRNQKLSRLLSIVNDAQAKAALTTTSILADIEKMRTEEAELARLKWVATDTIEANSPEFVSTSVTRESLAFLQYTSGSTGNPKGVMVSHGNILYNQQMLQLAAEHDEKTNFVSWLPLFHDMGLIGKVLRSLYLGSTCILMSPEAFLQKPIRWLQAISRYQATTSGGPNFAYELCTRHISAEQKITLDLSSWQVAGNGAEPVRAETLQQFSEAFAGCGFRTEAFCPSYGMAETTLLIALGTPGHPTVLKHLQATELEQHRVVPIHPSQLGSKTLVSCGRTIMEQEIIIVDPHTQLQCSPAQVGEIWVAGQNVTQGYWQREAETQDTFAAYLAASHKGPYLRTGDLGFIDSDGELFITGRLKELIIIRGHNYYPQDIERVAQKSHPALRLHNGAAFSVEINGQEHLIFAQEVERTYLRKLDDAKLKDAIIDAIRRAISDEFNLKVDSVLLLRTNTLLKTSSGKIQRYACRQAFLNDTLNVVARNSDVCTSVTVTESSISSSQSDIEVYQLNNTASGQLVDPATIESWLLSCLSRHLKLPLEKLNVDEQLSTYGLDSVNGVMITGELAAWLNVNIEPNLIDTYRTIKAIAHYLSERLNSSSQSPQNLLSGSPTKPNSSNFELWPEYLELKKRLDIWKSAGDPFFKTHIGITTDITCIEEKMLISYGSSNYLGLSGQPYISDYAKQAIDQYGTSVSASRVISGEKPIHRELEREIADFIGVEDCIIFVCGHATNVTTIGHLLGERDLILYDALSHNSIQEGCKLSGARLLPFIHNDYQHLEQLLQNHRHRYERVLIVCEGVYSADGDVAPLPQFIEIKHRYDCLFMVDEAHSIGVLGASGRGISEYYGITPTQVDLWMGTLSKSFASSGGYIAGSAALVTYLKYTAPGFVFSVGPSPANTAASLAAIRLLRAEPERVKVLQERSTLLRQLLENSGFNVGLGQDSSIIPVIVGESEKAIRLSQAMFEAGINVAPMIYPSVGHNMARLRFFVTYLHTEEQLRLTVTTLIQQWHRLGFSS